MTIPDSQYNKMVEKLQTIKKLEVFKLRYDALKKLILGGKKKVNQSSIDLIELLIPEE